MTESVDGGHTPSTSREPTFAAVKAVDLQAAIRPETALERHLLRQPEIVAGMHWGTPRSGHPEGAVWRHVVEVLANVDRLVQLRAHDRRDLRLVTIVHDTFKYAEDRSSPRDWTRHHGVLAREFVERYTDRARVLALTEWHDEAYYCWRLDALAGRRNRARQRLDRLVALFGAELDLFFRFFVCDTLTGDKTPVPLEWFRRETELKTPLWPGWRREPVRG